MIKFIARCLIWTWALISLSVQWNPVQAQIREMPDCSPPQTGTWVIQQDCKIPHDVTALGDVTIRNGVTLRVTPGGTLFVDFTNHALRVRPGGRVEIQAGGKIGTKVVDINPAELPQSILDPEVTAWASIRGLSSSAFSDHFKEMVDDGKMIIDIEVDELNDRQQVGAVWMQNPDDRGWASLRNMTNRQFSQRWEQYRDAGYILIDQNAYQLDDQLRYSGVWMQNVEGVGWASFRNLTSEQFLEKFDQYKERYIPVDVEAYPYGSGTRYSMIWVRNVDNIGWILRRNMSPSNYADRFQQYSDEYLVHDLESYVRNGNQNFAAIWYENRDNKYWYAYRDMTDNRFTNRWLQLRDAGYRLHDYEAYTLPNGNIRYAGIWKQNGSRQDWPLKDQVTELLQNYADQRNIPGMSVVIVEGGAFKYMRGFGHADIAANKVANSRTVMRLASISKAIGGTMLVDLEEEGKIDLEQTTRSYVPSMPLHHTHTVGQLASHRGGVGHYSAYGLGSVTDSYDTAVDAAQLFWDQPLSITPGSGCLYSTHSWTLAAAAAEEALGKPIAQIMEDELNTKYELPPILVEDRNTSRYLRAKLYDSNNNEVTADVIDWKVWGGGLEGSAYALAQLGRRLVRGDILSQAGLDKLWTAPDSNCNFAFGWSTGTEQNTPVVAKNGGQLGASSYLRIYPEKEIVIAVLMNRQDSSNLATTIGRELGTMLLDSLPTTPTFLLSFVPIVEPEMERLLDGDLFEAVSAITEEEEIEEALPANATLVLRPPAEVQIDAEEAVGVAAAPGDVNCDNAINSIDALFVLQRDIGQRQDSDQCESAREPGMLYLPACDVNGDGECGSVDALFILQCDIGRANPLCPDDGVVSSQVNRITEGNATLRIETAGTTSELTQGDTFTVTVMADSDAEVGAVTASIRYDSAQFKAVSCQIGFDMGGCNPTYGADSVRFNVAMPSGLSGSLHLVDIAFERIGNEEASAFELEAHTFADIAGGALSVMTEVASMNANVSSSYLLYLPVVER